jgi:protein-tyrosine phosphatase
MGSTVIKLLFVCTGNICRSPTAEGVFRHLAGERGLSARFQADSAGTESYHAGEPPDARAISVAAKRGVRIEDQRARRLAPEDYLTFDYIFAMDFGHFDKIKSRAPGNHKAKIEMFLRGSNAKNIEVPDPWYGGEKDFENVYTLIEEGVCALLDRLERDHRP